MQTPVDHSGHNGSVSPLRDNRRRLRHGQRNPECTLSGGQSSSIRRNQGEFQAERDLSRRLPPLTTAFPRDCSYGGINISYTYTGLGVTFSYSGLDADLHHGRFFSSSAPVAGFVIDGASPPSGSEEPDVTVQFNDTSTNSPSALSWDFGDGGTSTSPNPLHTFTAAGTYPVTLKVYNVLGQETDSYSLDYTVKVPTIAYQASAGANGSITPSGTVVVNEGSSTVFTFDPDPLYQVADILVDGISIGAVTSVTFGSADIDDHTITASFRTDPGGGKL